MPTDPSVEPGSFAGERHQFRFVVLGKVESLDDFGPLGDGAFSLGRATFGHAESEEETLRHLVGDHVVVAVDGDAGTVAGMTILATATGAGLPEGLLLRSAEVSQSMTIAHLQGTVIRPDARGRGLYRELNRLRFDSILERRIRFVSTTTQNVKVERGVRSILHELVSDEQIDGWSLDTEVRPGFYGQLLVADQPATVGTPFEHLDREAGDACTLLFDLRYEAAS